MFYDIIVPSCLPLGAVNLNRDGARHIAMLCVALQHPSIRVEAQPNKQFLVTGGRSDVAASYLERIYEKHALTTPAEIEIEQAIPAYMGLGSRAQMGLGMATIAALVNGRDRTDVEFIASALGLEPTQNINIAASMQGGLLLVDAEQTANQAPLVYQRAELDSDEKSAWGFVLVLPRVAEHPETFEVDRLAALVHAQGTSTDDSGHIVEKTLYPAVAQDDIETFGHGLMELQRANANALSAMNIDTSASLEEQKIFDIMRNEGAVAWGKSPSGFGLYALTRGARSTIEMRKALRTIFDYDHGDMLATISQNAGIRVIEKKGTLQKRIS